ncbi:MAG: hypothetical protein ACLP59_15595 [Bryobacteraceae bacterium]
MFLLMCFTLLWQCAALASQEESHHACGHCCLLCHAGPLLVLQTAIKITVTPVFLVVWLAAAPDLAPFRAAQLSPDSSRAPPA